MSKIGVAEVLPNQFLRRRQRRGVMGPGHVRFSTSSEHPGRHIFGRGEGCVWEITPFPLL